jgi:hypothetical protein
MPDAIPPRAREVRQRVRAQQGRRARVGLQSDGEELPGLRRGCWLAVDRDQPHRDHRGALRVDGVDAHRAQSLPRRRVRGIGRRSLEELAERASPALAQRRHAQGPLEVAPSVTRQVEESVDVGHRHRLRAPLEEQDVVARLHVALFEHPQVEAGPAVGDEQRGHPRLVHPDPHAVAGHARLADLEDGRTHAVAVTDAHLVVSESVHGEVLAELAVDEVVAPEELLPVPLRRRLVDEHRPVDTAVSAQVAVAIAVDVEATDHPTALHGLLPDARVHDPALPRDVAWHAHVHGDQLTVQGLTHQVVLHLIGGAAAGPGRTLLRTPRVGCDARSSLSRSYLTPA